jgi:RNA polymerase sigma-70 factor (ECF subfamily)
VEPGSIDFSTWYAAERDGLVRSLLVLGADPDGARDAVAEAFSRAYERWGRVASMAAPTGWVYRVALNDLRRRHRRSRMEGTLLARTRGRARPDGSDGTGEPGGTHADAELWAAVTELPLRQRQVIVLRYVADLRERDVAVALGISEGAASAALSAARRRLAEALSPASPPPASTAARSTASDEEESA